MSPQRKEGIAAITFIYDILRRRRDVLGQIPITVLSNEQCCQLPESQTEAYFFWVFKLQTRDLKIWQAEHAIP